MISEDNHSRKIFSRLAKELQVEYAVVGGKMEQYRDKTLGGWIINISAEDRATVTEYLNSESIVWSECTEEV